MSSRHQTKAVVLAVREHGEADKIVTFFSPLLGKFAGIAKGAKRSKRRFVNKLELFSFLEVLYSTGARSSLVRVEEAELIEPFMALREHYERYGAAALVCDLMLAWTRGSDGNDSLFFLLVWALRSLSDGRDPAGTVILFNMKLLRIMGYEPHLAGCIACSRLDPAGRPYVFALHRGGLLCRACRTAASSSLPFSLSTAKLLAQAQKLPLEKLGRLRFSGASRREALQLLSRYSSLLLQKDLHSWRFVAHETEGHNRQL